MQHRNLEPYFYYVSISKEEADKHIVIRDVCDHILIDILKLDGCLNRRPIQ
jgi:hypothetical protein